MPIGNTYQLKFNSANFENKECTVNIIDTNGANNPYSFFYIVSDNGDGTVTIKAIWTNIPAASAVQFIWVDDDDILTLIPGTGTTSPKVFTIPNNYTKIIAKVSYTDGRPDEEFDLTALQPSTIPLEANGNAFDITVIDNDEDKYRSVRGKQCTIRFKSTQNVNLSTFAAGSYDQRWRVEAFIEDKPVFKGHLVPDDSTEPFLSPSNVVVLTANDGLGRLKDEALTDFDNANPRGYYRMAKLIAFALRKTGLSLPINVVNNIKEESSATIEWPLVFDAPARFIAAEHPLLIVGRTITISNTALNNITAPIILKVGPIAFGPHTGKYFFYFDDTIYSTTPETADNAIIGDTKGHIYHRIFLNAKTFEADINASIDSYRALEYMLGESCYITQEKGEWWIYRLDEQARRSTAKVNVYDADGEWANEISHDAFGKLVKIDTPIWFSKKQTQVSIAGAHKHIKHSLRYEYPKEIVCNIDFNRGDVITAPDLNAANSTGDYEVACWEMVGLFGYAVSSEALIRRRFEYGYEKERYLVITPSAVDGGSVQVAQAEAINVTAKDKATVSVDFRRPNNIGAGEGNVPYRIMYIWLVDANGEYWHWTNLHGSGTDPRWIGPNVSHGNFPFTQSWVLNDVDEREWQTFSTDIAPFPADGKLYMGLMQQNWFTNFNDNYDAHYSNFRFEYSKYLNGGYRKFTGHYYKMTQASNADKYRPIREKTVYIGDLPDMKMKGAMLVESGSDYILAGRFYDGAEHSGTVPDSALMPYGQLLAIDCFNQYNREFRIFRASLQGLTTDVEDAQDRADLPGNIHRYQFGDASEHTNNKIFQLIGFEQNIKWCGWTGIFKEIYDSTVARANEVLEFKYTES